MTLAGVTSTQGRFLSINPPSFVLYLHPSEKINETIFR
jgi:hypothetical protein